MEITSQAKKKIAVIGAGAAGLTAAYLLNKSHDVFLFEKNSYFGGHANTVTVNDYDNGTLDVDTGFIVFNDKNYPNFTKLINELAVSYQKSDMSFSYYSKKPFKLYSSDIPFGMFALKRNLINFKFYKFLYSILAFNKAAIVDVENGIDIELTLRQYLNKYNYPSQLIDDYIVPMGAAIWSASFSEILEFPARTFLNFWNNHGLLQLQGRPQWFTVTGGSRNYVKHIIKSLQHKPQDSSYILSVNRTNSYAVIKMKDGVEHVFDKVVIATHADEALRLLGDPTNDEKRLLGVWSYSNNKTYFHTDTRVMPSREVAWTAWNYVKESTDPEDPVSLTYWMNRLQKLPSKVPYLVTLNTKIDIDPAKIIREINYTHPIFSAKSLASQSSLSSLNGKHQTYFCGSYFKNGFHEDAVSSGVEVAKLLGIEW
tara:strand:- start:2055 stop:3332 length:1278 start_codon:yes stop_codon:yes gene_type:complete